MQITVHDEECLQLIAKELIGVGQLFRHLNVLPSFQLHAAGRCPQSMPAQDLRGKDYAYGLWRDYELSCSKISCRFVERFAPDLFTL